MFICLYKNKRILKILVLKNKKLEELKNISRIHFVNTYNGECLNVFRN